MGPGRGLALWVSVDAALFSVASGALWSGLLGKDWAALLVAALGAIHIGTVTYVALVRGAGDAGAYRDQTSR